MGWGFKTEKKIATCDCLCSHIIVTKFSQEDLYTISFVTSYFEKAKDTFFRRLWHAFRHKPIYHAEVCLTGADYQKFVSDLAQPFVEVEKQDREDFPLPLL